MLPEFIIVGASKSGTTSLFYTLKSHPEIFLPEEKELNFFSKNSMSLHDYKLIFDGYDHMLKGEASPSYLYVAGVPERIHELIPSCKIVVILRNPVNRFISDFKYSVQMGLNSPDINSFYSKDTLDVSYWYSKSAMLEKGKYAKQLKNYLRIFGPEKIKVFLFEDLLSNPKELYCDLQNFLQVNPIDLESKHENKGANILVKDRFKTLTEVLNGEIRIGKMFGLIDNRSKKWIKEKIRMLNRSSEAVEIEPSEQMINDLKSIYLSEIGELSTLINRDVSNWTGKNVY